VKHTSADTSGQWIARINEWSNLELDDGAASALERYAEWLETEAVAAGAIGPDELDRLWPRHVGDSLLYAAVFRHRRGGAIDVGSGAGLPGIPVAIACPHLEVTLLDRSGRRSALLRRVVRILRVANVRVLEADIDVIEGTFEVIVARASLPPDQAFPRVRRLLAPGGEAVVGLSRQSPPDAAALVAGAARHGLQAEMVTIPADVLDSPAWLLRMTHRDQHS